MKFISITFWMDFFMSSSFFNFILKLKFSSVYMVGSPSKWYGLFGFSSLKVSKRKLILGCLLDFDFFPSEIFGTVAKKKKNV